MSWVRCASSDGRTYYANTETQATQWEAPPGFEEWWELWDASRGVSYFYCATTGAKSWTRPDGHAVQVWIFPLFYGHCLVGDEAYCLCLCLSGRSGVLDVDSADRKKKKKTDPPNRNPNPRSHSAFRAFRRPPTAKPTRRTRARSPRRVLVPSPARRRRHAPALPRTPTRLPR